MSKYSNFDAKYLENEKYLLSIIEKKRIVYIILIDSTYRTIFMHARHKVISYYIFKKGGWPLYLGTKRLGKSIQNNLKTINIMKCIKEAKLLIVAISVTIA